MSKDLYILYLISPLPIKIMILQYVFGMKNYSDFLKTSGNNIIAGMVSGINEDMPAIADMNDDISTII